MIQGLVPIVDYAENYKVVSRCGNKIVHGRISQLIPRFPDYYHSGEYILLLFNRGNLKCSVNLREFEIKSPAAMFVSVEHLLHVSEADREVEVDCLTLKHGVGEDLGLNMDYNAFLRILVQPLAVLSEEEMKVAHAHLGLIDRILMRQSDSVRYGMVLHQIRSLAALLVNAYQHSCEHHMMSRNEEIAGRFMSLVEECCREHHDVAWYAGRLCLSPKHMSHVVKSVTGMPAVRCIEANLTRQAQSLLLTSSLTIQQISERLGFQNQSHFGTFFRRNTGMSPKYCRKRGG